MTFKDKKNCRVLELQCRDKLKRLDERTEDCVKPISSYRQHCQPISPTKTRFINRLSSEAMADFFISYHHNDRQWAEWIAWMLEEAGYDTFIQSWDFRAGADFVMEMQQAATATKKTIVLLSENYLNAEYAQPEWGNAFARDPRGNARTLIPIRIRECRPSGLLATHVYVDLVGLSEDGARDAIIGAIKEERAKPAQSPTFPGSGVSQPDGTPLGQQRYPGGISSAIEVWHEKLEFLRAQEPVTSDAEAKFRIREMIKEAEQRIAELGVATNRGTVTASASRIYPSRLPRTGEYLVGRASELRLLNRAWQSTGTNVVQVVSSGGIGKTQLVKKWRESLLDSELAPPRVYDWSFYSQSTQQHASADEFFDRALRWFGERDPTSVGDAWSKGERLAQLVKGEPTLLILDGVDSLQHPPGPQQGELKDPALQSLLRELSKSNPGLCVVTTRVAVPDLASISEPQRATIDLGALSAADGAELLTRYGVTGEWEELQQTSRDYGGHSLALILLSTYLRDRFGGDVTQRSQVHWAPEASEESFSPVASHARKVMDSYVTWLEKERGHGDIGLAAVTIIRLMGLFNRPADAGCLAALRAEPAIPGLTEPLFAWSDRDALWQQAVVRLRQALLLAEAETERVAEIVEMSDRSSPQPPSTSTSLDAHPLVREHFAAELTERHSNAAREAHRRLYEHLKASAPEFPSNLHDMMPLYHAVAHGCQAGLWQDVLDELYWRRISRGNDSFSTRKLGAFAADLASLEHFFIRRWEVPVDALNAPASALLMDISGFALRALGRLSEAQQATAGSLKSSLDHKDWKSGAVRACNLSELSLMVGDIASAVRESEQAVELSDRSSDLFMRLSARATLADALNAAGATDAALAAYRETESLQAELQPQYPFLFSKRGFQYCELLLMEFEPGFSGVSYDASASEERLRQIRNRAQSTLPTSKQHGDLVSIALDHLTLGRAWLIEAQLKSPNYVGEFFGRSLSTELATANEAELADLLVRAENHINESVSLCRQAGRKDELPRCLTVRASLWRTRLASGFADQRELTQRAQQDLDEADQIAHRAAITIRRIETALERCLLAKTLNRFNDAEESLELAQQLVHQTKRRFDAHEPAWDDWRPPAYAHNFKSGQVVSYCRYNAQLEWLQRRGLQSKTIRCASHFFESTGYFQTHPISPHLVAVTEENSHASIIAEWQGDPSGIAADISIHTRDAGSFEKVYVVYEDSLLDDPQQSEADALRPIRSAFSCDVIPLSVNAITTATKPDERLALLRGIEDRYITRTDPYFESKPVDDQIWFFGRETLMETVSRLLAQGQHVGVFGLRKVGKTSFLNLLRQRADVADTRSVHKTAC